MRLIPGIVAMFWCLALAALNVGSYVRHLDTGDQAGFALGTVFLVLWFLPIADTLLLIGTIGLAPPGTHEESRLVRGIAMTSAILGGACFLVYGVWMASMQLPPSLPGSRPSLTESLGAGTYTGAILALAVTMLACGLAVRPGSKSPRDGGPPWLLATILAALAMVIVPAAAFLFAGGLAKHVAPQGPQAIIVLQTLFMAWPALVWIAALVWSAWLLYRRRKAARRLDLLPETVH